MRIVSFARRILYLSLLSLSLVVRLEWSPISDCEVVNCCDTAILLYCVIADLIFILVEKSDVLIVNVGCLAQQWQFPLLAHLIIVGYPINYNYSHVKSNRTVRNASLCLWPTCLRYDNFAKMMVVTTHYTSPQHSIITSYILFFNWNYNSPALFVKCFCACACLVKNDISKIYIKSTCTISF